MKKVAVFLLLLTASFMFSQKLNNKEVLVSCGLCQFDQNHMKSCTLTAKIDGKVYTVKGTGINDHGDAHGKDGFCKAVRKAKVTGKIKKDQLVVTKFELLPAEK